jgi:hypothetical protein
VSDDLWAYPVRARPEQHRSPVGYRVLAVDGAIGTVDEASDEVGAACLVVDTGPWIFGRKVMIPAGTVDRIDHEQETVHVRRTKEQIKDSPDYGLRADQGDPAYRELLGGYYRPLPR